MALQEEITPASRCLHYTSHTARRAGAFQTKVGLQQRLATFVAHGQRLQSGNATDSATKTIAIRTVKNIVEICRK